MSRLKQNKVVINVSGMSAEESILFCGMSVPPKCYNGTWRQPLNLDCEFPVYVSECGTSRLLLTNVKLEALISRGYAKMILHTEETTDIP